METERGEGERWRGRKPKMGMRGGETEAGGPAAVDRRWRWQAKRYDPPAPGLPSKDLKGWHHSRRACFSPVSKTREWKRASRTSVRICINHMNGGKVRGLGRDKTPCMFLTDPLL